MRIEILFDFYSSAISSDTRPELPIEREIGAKVNWQKAKGIYLNSNVINIALNIINVFCYQKSKILSYIFRYKVCICIFVSLD